MFTEMVASRSGTPGFPALDPNTIVHGEQSIEILRPIPTVSGPGWKLRKQISAVHDKGKSLVLETEVRLVSPTGLTHAIMIGSAFYIGGGQGTGFSKSIVKKPPGAQKTPTSAPDHVVTERTSESQALLYRLSGDYNALHADELVGMKTFGGVILHGLCSLGHAARAVLQAVEPRDGKRGAPAAQLRTLSLRFTSPVKPGDELQTKVCQAANVIETALTPPFRCGKSAKRTARSRSSLSRRSPALARRALRATRLCSRRQEHRPSFKQRVCMKR